MNFVSAVDVRLLTSFWICLWFSLSSRSYYLTLGGAEGGEPLLVVKPAGWFCRSSWFLQVVGDWAQFSLSGGSATEGSSVWATIVTGAQLPAHCPHSTVQPALYILHSCTGLAPVSHLALHPFDQSEVHRVGANRAHIPPSLLAGKLQGLCPLCLSSPFEKSLCGCHCRSEPLCSFPHTPTLWQVQSLSVSRPVMALLFSQLQMSPGYPLPPLPGTAGGCCPSLGALPVLSMCAAFSPSGVFKSLLGKVCDFPP